MNDFSRKRRKIWIIALLILSACVYAVYRYVQPPEHAEITKKDIVEGLVRAGRSEKAPPPPVYVPIEIKHPVRLAIGSLGFGRDNQNENVQDLVLAQLTGARGLELVERQSLERVLGELNLSLSGLVRARDALRAGKLVKADWFLLGSPVKVAGTNAVVLRLVDARTGIMRDAGVFSVDRPTTQVAADIARFVRESRESAARPEGHTFLAIGAFRDLSINRRQAAFPQQLRSYLTAAYHSSGVTLLEREAVDTLLQEVRLDLAGLADGSETNAPQPMQSTYWLVNGAFQSYETTNFQVELDLEIAHAFGRREHVLLRGNPDESLFAQAKSAIDWQIKTNANTAWPTRNNEARMQMSIGRELASYSGNWDLIFPQNYWDMDATQRAKRQYNVGEAIRAFETVMLLEPTNREAKMFLATCVRLQSYSRMDEARGYYREIIEEPVKDQWTTTAQQALHFSFEREYPEEKARWYRSALSQVTNSAIARNYREEAEAAEKEMVFNQGGQKSQEIAEQDLLVKMTNALLGNIYGGVGIQDYVASFGTNKSAAGKRLAELYPSFKSKATNAIPYLLAAVVTAQVDTNQPVVTEFQELLDKYAGHPDAISRSKAFWEHIWRPVCDWSFQYKDYRIAATLLEDEIGATPFDPYHTFHLEDEQKFTLAYAYLQLAEWSKALAIFQSYSNRPVDVGSHGPWGEAFSVILTSKQAAYCRQKLGLPPVSNPLEFDMGKSVQCMCTISTFVADDSGLWIGIEGQLLHLSFDLETNLVVRLPMSPSTAISSLALHSSSVLVGTTGEGLIEYNKETRKCRQFKTSDGLTTDSISCAQVLGDKLWIGYGQLDWQGRVAPGGHGVSFLDLSNLKFTSFTPSIAMGKDAYAKVGTNVQLDSIVGKLVPYGIGAIDGRPEEAWFAGENRVLRRYRVAGDAWDFPTEIGGVSSLTADADRLYVGQSWSSFNDSEGPIGLAIVSFKDLKVQSFGKMDGLPAGSVSALALDGNNLWVGGKGFIAMVDVKEQKIRKIAYIQSRFVDRIQIAGGYVWAQFDWHLHRASLKNLE